MKTRISAFCDEYKKLLGPIDDSIGRVIGAIDEESRQDLLDGVQARLSDARHRFRSLREKIEHQQAYLIIFGPLKSGKSTLMNAISGTYVSEVTSMPAYPCLVYVSHGEETEFSAIKYNGTSQEFTDKESLSEVLEESHAHLASRIRMHELQGEEFDPRVHYTEAVRRIDVRTPVPALREANTVLVDTPGLYSRMKFGYDLMTREFRDSAACAVFVVKSDNLFLDQVFDEFAELLKEFSRIFLVVNIDSGKRDLQPDGTLQPSIESSDPDRIVGAFKSLAMTAPLRDAFEAGRLQIYAVDLLNAAVGSLGQAGGRATDPAFDTFLSDLTEYLNSSDYLREFECDSLRQGAAICAEVRDACNLAAIEPFQRQQSELQTVAEEVPALISVIDQLSGSDMAGSFGKSRSYCLDSAGLIAKTARHDLQGQMRQSLNLWMDNDESLKDLVGHWNRAVDKVCEPIATALPHILASQFNTPTGGVEFNAPLIEQLHELELELGAFVRPAAAKLAALPAPVWEPLQLDPDQITVSRTLLDRLLFRPMPTIREQLFGPGGTTDRPITPAAKQKRLSEHGFVELHSLIDALLDKSFPDPQNRYVEEHADAFVAQVSAGIKGQLGLLKNKLAGQLDATRERMAADARIFAAVERLDGEVAFVGETLGAMQRSQSPQLEQHPDAGGHVALPEPDSDEACEVPDEALLEEEAAVAAMADDQ